MPHRAILLLSLLAGCVWTAEHPASPSGASPYLAGKNDAQQAFARQAATATPPSGANPGFIGSYLWGGRADQAYRPFFQWELRLKGGSAAAPELTCRIATLGPNKQILNQGDWKTLGNLAAGATIEFDYRQNCPTFNAFQVELAWQGGKETYIAWDKFTVPAALGELVGIPFLATTNQNFEYNSSTRTATVTYMIWNLGGLPAKELVQILNFKNEQGKVVFSRAGKPEKNDIPPGGIKEQKLVFTGVPAFATIGIESKTTDIVSLDPGAITGAKDLEIAKVRAEGKQLKAHVRNGTGNDLAGVVVTIVLQGKDSKALKTFELPVGKLAQGEERDLAADLVGTPPWNGYETSWRSAGETAPAAAPALPVLAVDGVELAITQTKAVKDSLQVTGRLANRLTRELTGLKVTFRAPDDGGKPQTAEVTIDRLAKGETMDLAFLLPGTKALTGLVMTWKAETPAAPAGEAGKTE